MAKAYRSLGLLLATALLSSLRLSSLPATRQQRFAAGQLPITLDELLDPRSQFDAWKPDLSSGYRIEFIDPGTNDVKAEHDFYFGKQLRWPYRPPRLQHK